MSNVQFLMHTTNFTQGSLTFVYMVFCECSLKKNASVHWDNLIDGSSDKLVNPDELVNATIV